jgi:hypothetical protein
MTGPNANAASRMPPGNYHPAIHETPNLSPMLHHLPELFLIFLLAECVRMELQRPCRKFR